MRLRTANKIMQHYRIAPDLLRKLEKHARKNHVTRTWVVEWALRQYLRASQESEP